MQYGNWYNLWLGISWGFMGIISSPGSGRRRRRLLSMEIRGTSAPSSSTPIDVIWCIMIWSVTILLLSVGYWRRKWTITQVDCPQGSSSSSGPSLTLTSCDHVKQIRNLFKSPNRQIYDNWDCLSACLTIPSLSGLKHCRLWWLWGHLMAFPAGYSNPITFRLLHIFFQRN